ncbi:MAG: hypothetical protein C0594_02365 [Marinilabiliales bacterium]|nr:MAG: hypothetical protein C0594_02365 [Marinilabiliales bacterium]
MRKLSIIFLLGFTYFSVAASQLDSLKQQRKQYLQITFGEPRDSVNYEELKQLIVLTNPIIDLASEMDSIIQNQADEISVLNENSSKMIKEQESKETFLLTIYGAAGGVGLMMIIFLILFIAKLSKVKKLKSSLDQLTQIENKKSEETKNYKEKLDNAENLLKEKETIIDEEKKFNKEKLDEIELLNLEIKQLKDKIVVTEKELEEKSAIDTNILNEIQQLKEQNVILSEEKDTLTLELQRMDNSEAESKLAEFENKFQQVEARNNELEQKLQAFEEEKQSFSNKIKTLTDINEQLSIVKENMSQKLVEERAYSDKLNNKLDLFEDELDKQEAELAELNRKLQEKMLPESQKRLDELEINLVKIEKLKRLNEIEILSEEEFLELKDQIIKQIKS